MRPNLDLDSGRLLQTLAGAVPLPCLKVTLGDPPFLVALSGYSAAPLLPLLDDTGELVTPATLQFIAKTVTATVADYAGDNIVLGSVDISAAADQLVSCGENWKSDALLALFAAQPASVSLKGQYRWRSGLDASLGNPWSRSCLFDVRVANSLFLDDIVPGASPVSADVLYLKNIVALTGADSTALDHVAIAHLPPLTILKVVIPGRGGSEWRVEADAGAPVTDVEGGIIVTTDHDAESNAFHLTRVSGY